MRRHIYLRAFHQRMHHTHLEAANLPAQIQALQSLALDQEPAGTSAGMLQQWSWACKHATKLSKLYQAFVKLQVMHMVRLKHCTCRSHAR
jgi:hypothetical protein